MIKTILLLLLTVLSFSVPVIYAGLKTETSTTETQSNLKIDNIKQGTTITGVINMGLVLSLMAGDIIQFTTPLGDRFLCIVKTTETDNANGLVKIFGDVLNTKNGSFGFMFTKTGDVGGAIMLRDINKLYKVSFNDAAKGFIFLPDMPKETIN